MSATAQKMIAEIERLDRAGKTDQLRGLFGFEEAASVEQSEATNVVLRELMEAVKVLREDVNALKSEIRKDD